MKTKAICTTCLLAALICGRPAKAELVMSLQQVGPDVVATANGTVNLSDLTFFSAANSSQPTIMPIVGELTVGFAPVGLGANNDLYTGISGPASFGTGDFFEGRVTGTGNLVGLNDAATILVPLGYISGDPLSGTVTFSSTTLNNLGVIPDVYRWTWGTGANADSLVLFAGVPERPD